MRYFEFCKWKKNKCSILSDHAACQMIRRIDIQCHRIKNRIVLAHKNWSIDRSIIRLR